MRINDEDRLKLIYESIFSGNVDSDDEDTDDTDSDTEDTEKSDKKDKKKKEKSDSDDDSDSDKDKDKENDDDDDDGDDNESDESDESDESSAKEKSPAKSKLKALQRQYNDLLIDLFDKFAVECIETALEEADSSFGENIEDILAYALDMLKSKILEELGVDCGASVDGECGEVEIVDEPVDDQIAIDDEQEGEEGEEGEERKMPPEAMGSFDPDVGKKYPMEINV